MQCNVVSLFFFFPSPLRCWSRLGTYNSADVQILLERNRKKRRRKSAKQLKSLNHHCPPPPPFFSSSFLPVPLAFSLLHLGGGIGYFSAFFPISSSSLHLCFLAPPPPVQSTCSCCSVDFSAWVRYAEGLDRCGRRESSRGLARSTVSVPLLSARMEYMFTYRKMRDGNQEGEREKRLLREGVCAVPSSDRLSQVPSPLPPSHPIHLFHDPSGPCHPRTITHIPL
ncbi:hypothetical protein CSPX01_11630 [Colletotrichum filicis]|nr:hypothetical protein CSPX01_11630 [Colletotrichum filicis]